MASICSYVQSKQFFREEGTKITDVKELSINNKNNRDLFIFKRLTKARINQQPHVPITKFSPINHIVLRSIMTISIVLLHVSFFGESHIASGFRTSVRFLP